MSKQVAVRFLAFTTRQTEVDRNLTLDRDALCLCRLSTPRLE